MFIWNICLSPNTGIQFLQCVSVVSLHAFCHFVIGKVVFIYLLSDIEKVLNIIFSNLHKPWIGTCWLRWLVLLLILFTRSPSLRQLLLQCPVSNNIQLLQSEFGSRKILQLRSASFGHLYTVPMPTLVVLQ